MKNNKGFTLIELLVVIAIIGILATLSVVTLSGAREKARDARRMSDLKQISTAMELYMANTDSYPVGGSACTNGELANSDAMCVGNSITDGINVQLNAIPDDPNDGSRGSAAGEYCYDSTNSSATSYCIEAVLERNESTYFVCSDGSCYDDNTGCAGCSS